MAQHPPAGHLSQTSTNPPKPTRLPSHAPAQDDSSPDHLWRNSLDFQPEAKYDGFSYHDIMLAPLADAMRIALRDTVATRAWVGEKPTIYFSLQVGHPGYAWATSAYAAAEGVPCGRSRPICAAAESSAWRRGVRGRRGGGGRRRRSGRQATPGQRSRTLRRAQTHPQGEMGATIMKYPALWAAVIEPLRRRVGAMATVLFGIGERGRWTEGLK